METVSDYCAASCGECTRLTEERSICMQMKIAESLAIPLETEWITDYSLLFRALWDRGYVEYDQLRALINSAAAFIRDFGGPTEKWIDEHLDDFLAFSEADMSERAPTQCETFADRIIRILEIPYDPGFACANG